VSAPRHADVPPEDCPRCRLAHALCAAHPEWTVSQIGESMKMSDRGTRVHLAHLAKWARLKDDRRTPVPGTTMERTLPPVPVEDLTPRDWASNQKIDCRTCARSLHALVAHSRGQWRGQISMDDLATRLEMSQHTVRMHVRTGHQTKNRIGHSLVGNGLVAFETSDAEIVGKDRYGRVVYKRRPDHFVLWPTHAKPETPVPDLTTCEGRAAVLLANTPWFDRTRPQASWTVRLVAELLADGCPSVEIEHRLNVTPRTPLPLQSQYRFARRRLIPLFDRRGEFIRPMPEALGAAPVVPVARRPVCPDCRAPLPSGVPSGAYCGGVVCRDPAFRTAPEPEPEPASILQLPVPRPERRRWEKLASVTGGNWLPPTADGTPF
jgi:hypothetical protein